MAMTKKDYERIAKALRVVAIEEERVFHMDGTPDDPGACWWKVLNELVWVFSESDPKFSKQNFRTAASSGRRYDYDESKKPIWPPTIPSARPGSP
tara:strand:+ start:326 stop:610 length:285 start_codon:yes stop_codon:yes gene_type:complete